MSNPHWLIHFADASRSPEYFAGQDAHTAAEARFKALLLNWDCRLFVEHKPQKPKYAVGVSVLLVNRDGWIALGQRPETIPAGGFLSTPGGRIEGEEHIEETAARELEEETGVRLKPSVFKTLGFKEHFRFNDHYFMFYVAAYYDGVLETKEPDKCLGWKWWKLEEVPLSRCTEPPDILTQLSRTRFGESRNGHTLRNSDLVGWYGRCSCGDDFEFKSEWTKHIGAIPAT